jgi:hypothetical protein
MGAPTIRSPSRFPETPKKMSTKGKRRKDKSGIVPTFEDKNSAPSTGRRCQKPTISLHIQETPVYSSREKTLFAPITIPATTSLSHTTSSPILSENYELSIQHPQCCTDSPCSQQPKYYRCITRVWVNSTTNYQVSTRT